MTSVDKKNSEILGRIREWFKSQLDERISDEEILEMCLKFSIAHLDQLLTENKAESKYLDSLLNKEYEKRKPIFDFISDILEDEYEMIKKSGKTIKEVIRESWKF
jgi:hypothetical protein